MEKAEVREATGTERLAWMAYQAGDMDATARWLKVAARNHILVRWLRAKRLLRAGKNSDAAGLLAGIVRELRTTAANTRRTAQTADAILPLTPETAFVPPFWGQLIYVGAGSPDSALMSPPAEAQPAAELALIRLADGQFCDALDLLLREGWWQDAAYIGEHVLTTRELQAYVTTHWPTLSGRLPPEVTAAVGNTENADVRLNLYKTDSNTLTGMHCFLIRHLLGRRLARDGSWEKAAVYLPPPWGAEAARIADWLRQGHDSQRAPAERGQKLLLAARLLRHHGMELLGTELEPDWSFCGGDFEWATSRDKGAGITAAESQRVAVNRFPDKRRFHYRYQAADLAWQAASLLPDNRDETALALWEAGSWLKDRDPKTADRFYKALVQRCGNTALGKAAAAKHWFPDRNIIPPAGSDAGNK